MNIEKEYQRWNVFKRNQERLEEEVESTHRIFFFETVQESKRERERNGSNIERKQNKTKQMANLNLLIEENCFDKFCYNYKKGVAVEVLQYKYDKFTILLGTISSNRFLADRYVTIDHFHKICSKKRKDERRVDQERNVTDLPSAK